MIGAARTRCLRARPRAWHEHDAPAVGVLHRGRCDRAPVRVLRLDREMSRRRQTPNDLLRDRPLAEVEHHEVVAGRRRTRAAFDMVRELKMVAGSRKPNERTGVAGVVGEASKERQADPRGVEVHNLVQPTGRPRDPHMRIGRGHDGPNATSAPPSRGAPTVAPRDHAAGSRLSPTSCAPLRTPARVVNRPRRTVQVGAVGTAGAQRPAFVGCQRGRIPARIPISEHCPGSCFASQPLRGCPQGERRVSVVGARPLRAVSPESLPYSS